MTDGNSIKPGIERLVAAYVDAFRIPENLNHYAPDDFESAQRRFVRFCLQNGHTFHLQEGINENRTEKRS
jgi:hypothetical protein